jgi:hypothetical protein
MSRLNNEIAVTKKGVATVLSKIEKNESKLYSDKKTLNNLFTQFSGIRLDSGVDIEFDSVNYLLESRQRELSNLKEKEVKIEVDDNELNANVFELKIQCDELEVVSKSICDNNLEYREILNDYNDLDEIADSLEIRKTDILDECERKAPKYFDSLSFKYLNDKNFSENTYKANNLIEHLDTWLAKKIDYQTNQSRYKMLMMMKEEAIRRSSEGVNKKLVAERKLANKRVEIETESGLTECKNLLSKASSIYKDNANELSVVRSKINAIEHQSDEVFSSAKMTLTEKLKGVKLEGLREKALETESVEDDRILEEIEHKMTTIESLESEINLYKTELKEKELSYHRAKELEREAKRRSLNSSSYRYNSSMDMDGLMTGYILGNIHQKSILDSFESNRSYVAPKTSSYDSSDSFGSGGFSSSSSFGGGSHSTTDSF